MKILNNTDNLSSFPLPGSVFNSDRDFCLRISSSYIDAATDERAKALVAGFMEDPDPEQFLENHHPRLHQVAERFGEFIADLETEAEGPKRKRALAVS